MKPVPDSTLDKVYVIHENPAWLPPLRAALAADGTPYEEWMLDGGSFDFTEPPPHGVFYNRISASAHTRGHDFAPEYTASVLAWLTAHGRRVVNNGRALELEVSKVKQYAALGAFGVRTPRTLVAVGRAAVRAAARDFGAPLILKPNRGGKGAGVRLFNSLAALDAFLDGPEYDAGRDGTMLIQQYVVPADGAIIRCEFVGGRFLYAVRVDASGGFELCPADACRIEDRVCPVGEKGPVGAAGAAGETGDGAAQEHTDPQFRILENFTHPNLDRFAAFLAANGIEIAGIEMIIDAEGVAWTYDVNTNTNYNAEAEQAAGLAGTPRAGMRAVARFLAAERARLRHAAPQARMAPPAAE